MKQVKNILGYCHFIFPPEWIIIVSRKKKIFQTISFHFYSYSEPELDRGKCVENGNDQNCQKENQENESTATTTTTMVAGSGNQEDFTNQGDLTNQEDITSQDDVTSQDEVTNQDEVTDPLMLIQVGQVESNYAGFDQDATSWTENQEELFSVDDLQHQDHVWTGSSREQESVDCLQEDHENQTEVWTENQHLDQVHEVGDVLNPYPEQQGASEGQNGDHENQNELWSENLNADQEFETVQNLDYADQLNGGGFGNATNQIEEVYQRPNVDSNEDYQREENFE